jgi:nucleoside-diphosphate-sugar epimerase
MKNAIITGSSGFVGHWLIEELVSHGVEVIAVVRSQDAANNLSKRYNNIEIVICPAADINKLPDLVKVKNVDVFYHLAWEGTSGMGRADVEMQLSNIRATCDTIKVAHILGCKRFINAGSIIEYEIMKYIPQDNSMPGAASIYGAAKLAADFMGKSLAVNLELPYISVIISNIYGPGEKSARIINTTIRKILNNEKTEFTPGNQLYDYIYISDAVKALYMIGDKGKAYTSYYIGNQKQYPLKDFIIRLRDVVNSDYELNFGGIPYVGALLRYDEFDTDKLYNEFGFIPQISFEQGIKNTMQWIIEND